MICHWSCSAVYQDYNTTFAGYEQNLHVSGPRKRQLQVAYPDQENK